MPRQETHKRVISLKDVRLASTKGHIAILKAKEPKEIPEPLFLEATKAGCIDFNAKTIQTLRETLKALEEDDSIISFDDPRAIVKDAVKTVMVYGEADAFTAAGVPKVLAVKASLDSDTAIPVDRELVYDLYVELDGDGVSVGSPPEPEVAAPADDDLGDGRTEDNLGLDSDTADELSAELSAATEIAAGN